jgi:Xaa-Pro dipeptidase
MNISEIQSALQELDLDGWLFYSFRGSDPIATEILRIGTGGPLATRRWFYLIPRVGEPVKIVHAIERDSLAHLPGKKLVYLPWKQLHGFVKSELHALTSGRSPRVAMQYSPNGAIPYVSRVDAGIVELIRSFGVDVVTSATLVQKFQSTLTDQQLVSHEQAAKDVYEIVHGAFSEIGKRIKNHIPTTEYDIQQYIMNQFADRSLVTHDAPIVGVNANSASPHYEPTIDVHAPIKEGDFVLIDLWAKCMGADCVYADITWTGYVGTKVPDEITSVFNIVRDARDAAAEFVRDEITSGRPVSGADVDDVCRDVIAAAGYGDLFIHRTGHSIQTEIHANGANIDNLETQDTRLLIPRTLFSIEPGIYLEHRFGIRSEIDMYVAEKEARITGGEPQREIVRILS